MLLKNLELINGQQIKMVMYLNTPVKINDHLIDAVRYLCLNKLAINHSGKYYIL